MDAGQALAELTAISSQVESAVVFAGSGEVLASTLGDEERSRHVVRTARDLLASASEARPSLGAEGVRQLEAALPEGSVFVVRDEERAVAATTAREPTTGLVLYDLRNCLRTLAQDEPSSEPGENAGESERAHEHAAAGSARNAVS